MGEFTDKMKATGNKIAGKAKEEVGALTDNQKPRAKPSRSRGRHRMCWAPSRASLATIYDTIAYS